MSGTLDGRPFVTLRALCDMLMARIAAILRAPDPPDPRRVNPSDLPELLELAAAGRAGRRRTWSTRVLCEVAAGERRFPVQAFLLGSARPDAPAVGFFGGVHGLERIGAEVAIAYLRSLVMRLRLGRHAAPPAGDDAAGVHAAGQSGRAVAGHARQSQRRRPDAQRAGRIAASACPT